MIPSAVTMIESLYTVEVSKETNSFDGWWTSEYLYSLERRAIFSKTWICVCHRSRLNIAGDYISFDLAGFPILLILGKDYIARAFHNVCRHRAYTITKKPAGSSLVLGCRYHGWSYDTKGQLVKAPQFDGIEGFTKSENGLFKIKTCMDQAGFIHINLDASQDGHAPSCEKILTFSTTRGISMNSKWLLEWRLDSAFNWKIIEACNFTSIETNYDPAGCAAVMKFFNSIFRRLPIDVSQSEILHLSPGLVLIYFPKANIWITVTIFPASASECTVICDVYSEKAVSLETTAIDTLKSYVTSYLSALEQHYDEVKEAPPGQDPSLLRVLKTHEKLERESGREIFPARRDKAGSEIFCKAQKLCNELDRVNIASHKLSSKGLARIDSGGLDW